MADGGWAVLGAAIGALGSMLTTWLNAYLRKKAPDPYDEEAQQILKEMLEIGPKWRKLETLSNVIGADPKLTRQFLLIIGARGSETNPNLWGLRTRNPLHAPSSST